MSAEIPTDLDSLLDEQWVAEEDSLDYNSDSKVDPLDKIEVIQLEEGETDPRIKLLSHSSRTTLHRCPRKYQLYRLNSRIADIEGDIELETKDTESKITFSYGSAVGVGVQSALEGKTRDQVILDTFLEWETDLLAETPRQKKSFWLAVFAVQKFIAMRNEGFLDEYSLVYYDGKPAIELPFQIILPNGYKYRGFVDAVLQHKTTKEILVLENKTTSHKTNSAQYKNSGQALGYSVVLDKLFPELSSYVVLYMVYETISYKYVELPFTKSLYQRALWLQELIIDIQTIELYESYGVYPMHGESCNDFFRPCEYLSLCTMHTDKLTKPLTKAVLNKIEEENEKYDFILDFYDLVNTQVAKAEE